MCHDEYAIVYEYQIFLFVVSLKPNLQIYFIIFDVFKTVSTSGQVDSQSHDESRLKLNQRQGNKFDKKHELIEKQSKHNLHVMKLQFLYFGVCTYLNSL